MVRVLPYARQAMDQNAEAYLVALCAQPAGLVLSFLRSRQLTKMVRSLLERDQGVTSYPRQVKYRQIRAFTKTVHPPEHTIVISAVRPKSDLWNMGVQLAAGPAEDLSGKASAVKLPLEIQ